MAYIYGLHNGDGVVRYVGLTRNTPRRRLTDHLRQARRGQSLPVHKWIRRHNYAVQCVVLEECDAEVVGDREAHWIAEMSKRARLMNMTGGGDGLVRPTPDVLERIGASMREKWRDPEYRERMRVAHLGIKPAPRTPEGRQRLIDASKGRKRTEEQRRRMSLSKMGINKGVPRPPEVRSKISAAQVGKPNRGIHTRWHAKRGLTVEGCPFC